MSTSQAEKGLRFLELHRAPGAFVVPNPWDAGSARLLAGLGFPALATSSAAIAGSWGRRDYGLRREDALARAHEIADAVDVPVSADLEEGFGPEPETVADTVRRAIDAGLAGCSIEDAAGNGKPFELALAKERVRAAVEAARRATFPFLITARAENYCRECHDLADTIARLQAYETAGADVLFAPGVPDLASVATIVGSLSRPLNVVGTMEGGTLSVARLAEVGVKRISLAAALFRAAFTGLREAASEVKTRGTFTFAARTLSPAEQNQLMR